MKLANSLIQLGCKLIPLTKPYVLEQTYAELLKALESSHLQGGGVYSKKCEIRSSEILEAGKEYSYPLVLVHWN